MYKRQPFDRVASGGVCTASRALPPHAAFFALGGEKFDGNLFAPEASRTAAAVVVSRVDVYKRQGKWNIPGNAFIAAKKRI